MDTLLPVLDRWKPFNAVVVGDFMLDELVYGDAERLSPDAPVPVLHVRRIERRAGGSANVCMDLAALRGTVRAIGAIGDDEAGRELAAALSREGVETSSLVVDRSRPTTLKRNYIGLAQARHPQKMFRVDVESREPLDRNVTDAILERLDRVLREGHVDLVCIEDYNKGVCTLELCQGVIERARRAGKPVFVDPARITDYSKYRGATTMTPNRTEAEIATGLKTDGEASIDHNAALAHALMKTCDLECVVLTLDRHGALLLEREGKGAKTRPPQSIPTVAREVYDVTGAGDMFLAGLAAARTQGCDWHDSVRFANAAAGLEVEVFGVQPIPLERVHHSLLMMNSKFTGKLRTPRELVVEVESQRRAGKRIVFTNGCFDILHAGHVALLDKAASFGDFLVVAMNTDASVRRLKGPGRPVNTQEDRARVLGALGCVGAVVFFDEQTPIDLIRAVRPDTLVKGADYTKDRVVGADFVESCGGRVELVDLVAGRSTTATIEKMRTPG